MTGLDTFTMEIRLCDDAGLVSHERTPFNPLDSELTYLKQINNLRSHGGLKPYTGEPFVCTGSAHLANEHIRCTSPVHSRGTVTDGLVTIRTVAAIGNFDAQMAAAEASMAALEEARKLMPPTLQAQHIARVEAVNTASSYEEREQALQRLKAWRAGVFDYAGTAINQGRFLMQADRHYLDQGIDRPMCAGVWLDWKPAAAS